MARTSGPRFKTTLSGSAIFETIAAISALTFWCLRALLYSARKAIETTILPSSPFTAPKPPCEHCKSNLGPAHPEASAS